MRYMRTRPTCMIWSKETVETILYPCYTRTFHKNNTHLPHQWLQWYLYGALSSQGDNLDIHCINSIHCTRKNGRLDRHLSNLSCIKFSLSSSRLPAATRKENHLQEEG